MLQKKTKKWLSYLCAMMLFFSSFSVSAAAEDAAITAGESVSLISSEESVVEQQPAPAADPTDEPTAAAENEPVEEPAEAQPAQAEELIQAEAQTMPLEAASAVQSQDAGSDAIFAVAILEGVRKQFFEMSFGDYVDVQVEGTYRSTPHLRSAKNIQDENILEAWTIHNLKPTSALTISAEVKALPALEKGQEMAVYALHGNQLLGEAVQSGLKIGDVVSFDLSVDGADGLAVGVFTPEIKETVLTPAVESNATVQLEGMLPEGVTATLEAVDSLPATIAAEVRPC